MMICGLKQTLPGVFQIIPESGSAFFLRTKYLKVVKEKRLYSIEDYDNQQDNFSEDEYADILSAALIYSAEKAALTYLARAEQCRFLLTQKLIHKGIDKICVKEALDYLEEVHYLDDSRFASAWLRSRAIDHAEGRRKLSAELISRGINREISKKALDEYFEEHNEIDLCKKAYNKLIRQKKKIERIGPSLISKGFSLSEIREVVNNGIKKII